jgi:lipopolysaccharide export system protein LptA
MTLKCASASLAVIAITLGASAHALTGDRDQPIQIEADRAELDDARGLTTYEGRVVATQGTLRISGERVVLHYDQDHRLTRAEAFGSPASYEQRLDGEPQPVRARAQRMEYLVGEGVIELYEGVTVSQGADTLSGNRVTYDTVNGRVRALRSGSGSDRVRVTITPRNRPESGAGPGR